MNTGHGHDCSDETKPPVSSYTGSVAAALAREPSTEGAYDKSLLWEDLQ
jgi:hypothetical protein